MDSSDGAPSNASSPRQYSDTEMSSSCATSSVASTLDDTDIKLSLNSLSQQTNSLFPHKAVMMSTTPIADPSSNSRNGSSSSTSSGWVRLNVGGKVFQTTRSTLMREPGSFLHRLCQEEMGLSTDKDETGAYLIDRDADFFSPILNYLRHGKLILNPGVSEEGILAEADFYNLPILSQLLIDRIQERENSVKSPVKFVYRVLQCHEEELASVVSAMSDGWKIVQVVPINSNYSAYSTEQQQEYLCIVERECVDKDGQIPESQDRAKLLQQRARHN